MQSICPSDNGQKNVVMISHVSKQNKYSLSKFWVERLQQVNFLLTKSSYNVCLCLIARLSVLCILESESIKLKKTLNSVNVKVQAGNLVNLTNKWLVAWAWSECNLNHWDIWHCIVSVLDHGFKTADIQLCCILWISHLWNRGKVFGNGSIVKFYVACWVLL